MVFVYNQAGGNGREAARMLPTEPRTLTGSTTHITQYVEPFIGVFENMGPMEATSNIFCDMDGIQAMYCVPGSGGQ